MREILAAAIVGAIYAMLFLLFLVVGELRTQTDICTQRANAIEGASQ
jgi:hypothetical protein